MGKSKNAKKKAILKAMMTIFIILIIIIIAFLVYRINNDKLMEKNIEHIFSEVEAKEANLTEYVVYGTKLNIKGEIEESIEAISSINLVLAGPKDENKKVKLNYNVLDNKISFYTSDLINVGIDLEDIKIGKYYMIVEVEYGKNLKKSYTIKNETEYASVLYYTLTKNNSNNRIDISFDEYEKKENRIKYMFLEVKHTKLPKDVYDVVIDPGHGGADTGAEYSGYRETDLTIKYAKRVKKELEELGLKVKLTRDGTESKESFGVYTVYNEKGRVNVVGDSKAKYVFSIHLNSIDEPNSQSGVEIYIPSRMNIDLAKEFAKNIVKYGKTDYSTLEATYRVADGIYARTFREWEIEDSIEDATKGNYEPYEIKEYTPYLYMLRETGGIATGAYVDGRNKVYGTNKYYNSNIGVEAYLLELGYINNKDNLKNMINNEDGYVQGIVETIKQNIIKE